MHDALNPPALTCKPSGLSTKLPLQHMIIQDNGIPTTRQLHRSQDYRLHELTYLPTHYNFPSVYATDCGYFHIMSCARYQPSSPLTCHTAADACPHNGPLESPPVFVRAGASEAHPILLRKTCLLHCHLPWKSVCYWMFCFNGCCYHGCKCKSVFTLNMLCGSKIQQKIPANVNTSMHSDLLTSGFARSWVEHG